MNTRTRLAARSVLLLLGSGLLLGAPSTPLEQAFDACWKADSPQAASAAAAMLIATGATFDDMLSRLRRGRPYAAQQTGVVTLRYPSLTGTFENRVTVPADYTPDAALPLRVQLHGGINRPSRVRSVSGADAHRRGRRTGSKVNDRSTSNPVDGPRPPGGPWCRSTTSRAWSTP